MLDAFIIEEIKRREEERRKRESERPVQELPLPEREPGRPLRQGEEDKPSRGVVIIDYSM